MYPSTSCWVHDGSAAVALQDPAEVVAQDQSYVDCEDVVALSESVRMYHFVSQAEEGSGDSDVISSPAPQTLTCQAYPGPLRTMALTREGSAFRQSASFCAYLISQEANRRSDGLGGQRVLHMAGSSPIYIRPRHGMLLNRLMTQSTAYPGPPICWSFAANRVSPSGVMHLRVPGPRASRR